jgi:multisubunit Na+/H+ antiporter MnhC subunit
MKARWIKIIATTIITIVLCFGLYLLNRYQTMEMCKAMGIIKQDVPFWGYK